MSKNRFLIVLGVLSLLLVAMVISFPLSNTPTSDERGRAADAARWTAMGEYFEKLEESQLQRSQVADTARWEAMGEYYLNQSRTGSAAKPLTQPAGRQWPIITCKCLESRNGSSHSVR
jgi:hypothetical protein